MELSYLASTSVSLRGIFWLYASKDGRGASLADLLDLAVVFNKSVALIIFWLNPKREISGVKYFCYHK